MKRALSFLLLFSLACATRPAVDPAVKAEIERIEKRLAAQPDDAPYTYILALYYDRANDAKKVVRWLERLEAMGWTLGIEPGAFRTATPEFQRVAARLDARVEPVKRATVAFRLPSNVNSEGIAYDPVDDVFYFSAGAAKLVRVTRDGAATDFPIEPAGAKFGRLGMHVDAQRRLLWVVNAVFDPKAPEEERGRSAVSAYDLRDGRLVRRVRLGSASEPAFFNDLAVMPDGTIFVTDTTRDQLFRLSPDAETFELWASGFTSPNGIVPSADARSLYVADFRGIERFDVATKARQLLATQTLLNGIDGLAEHRGTLLGIQNVLGHPRVVRVDPQTARVEVLEVKTLHSPATCAVAGNTLYFMANLSERDVEKVILEIGL